MKTAIVMTLAAALCAAFAPLAFSHCEVPCGIYDDRMRIDMILEHISTIEKSMQQITELSAAGEKNYNQIVRWVNNKDEHGEELQHIVSQYFMTQRIKPAAAASADYSKYQTHLELLHQMLVYAMKSKQTTDLSNVEKLRELTAQFRASYLGPEGEAHTH